MLRVLLIFLKLYCCFLALVEHLMIPLLLDIGWLNSILMAQLLPFYDQVHDL